MQQTLYGSEKIGIFQKENQIHYDFDVADGCGRPNDV